MAERENQLKLLFKRYDPGAGTKSGESHNIEFKGYISSLSDSTSPGWSDVTQMGRPDPVVFYSSWQRSISMNFLVLSYTSDEHKKNFDKLHYLAMIAYPVKKQSQGFNAPHIYYEVGNLLSGIGIISSLDYSWDDNTPWIEEKPIITSVSLNIRVLGDREFYRPDADKSKHFKLFGE